MLYLDTGWLADLQRELGVVAAGFSEFAATLTWLPRLYLGLNTLVAVLNDGQIDVLQKHEAAITFCADLQLLLGGAAPRLPEANHKLARAAEFIAAHCTQALKLDEIAAAAGLSATYLIRAFKQRYGMTPHAYLTSCRVQYSRAQLRRGREIADVALEAGFADQAHLQRVFKRLLAATPGEYKNAC